MTLAGLWFKPLSCAGLIRREGVGLSLSKQTSNGEIMSNHAECAKAIRQELKAKFKGIKFSVVAKSYAGGSSIRIYWMGEPEKEDVYLLTYKYTYGGFNSSTDCYEYDPTRAAGPKVSYVFCERN